MTEAPTPRPSRRLWSWCRCSFRWLRISLLALVLITLIGLTWLRMVGLPDFLRLRIVSELAERGISANFRSLRFHWFRGLVAEDLRVSWGGTNGPRIRIDEADLDLAPPPWHGSGDLIRGLAVLRGSVVLPLPATNAAPAELKVDGMAADIRFLPGDVWEVRRLAAQVLGMHLEVRATVTNTTALRRRRGPSNPEASSARVNTIRSIVDEVSRWSASAPPRLEMNLAIDGAEPSASQGDAYVAVPEITTPRGTLRDFRLSLRARPYPDVRGPLRTSAVLEIGEVQSGHGGLSGFAARMELDGPPPPDLPTNGTWSLSVDHVFVRGFRARELQASMTNVVDTSAPAAAGSLQDRPVVSRVSVQARSAEIGREPAGPVVTDQPRLNLEFRHTLRPAPPQEVRIDLAIDGAAGPLGALAGTELHGELRQRPEPGPTPAEIGFWEYLWPFAGELRVASSDVRSAKLDIEGVDVLARWEPPHLHLPRLNVRVGGGDLRAHGGLEVPPRRASLDFESTFDLHRLDPLLGPRSRENIARYQWKEPPWFQGRASATLPRWTDRKPDWDGEVKPTLRLDARFRVGEGSFKGIPFERAVSSLSFDGTWWRLPDLRTTRPEGAQEIAVDYNEETREYRVDARGRVFPPVLKPVLGEKSAEVLELFQFPEPVTAEVSVWGPWTEGTKQAILGNVQATNFVFRGQRFDALDSRIGYTNRTMVASPVTLHRDGATLTADGIGYSFAEDRVWLTNVVNTIDPAVVAAAISEGFPAKIAPYRFLRPPEVRVSGTLLARGTNATDLEFDIAGGPFQFWRLGAEQIRTRLIWKGSDLVLTNIEAAFYGGTLEGNAGFDLSRPDDGHYHFDAKARGSSLGALLSQANPEKTNRVEGVFDLDLHVTSARTSDIHTWDGHGQAQVRNGLLWNVPIFGFLSPVLNGVVPGLGNNRAESISATFTLTNSVIHTRDLVIACPPAKLLYRGTLDFEQRVTAKVEGQILSELGGFGPLVGLVLRPLTKLLEFRVTGTLSDVEAEPIYIPKFLLLPLQPFKVIRDIFKGNEPATNAPVAPAPVPVPPPIPTPSGPAPQ